jgi:16S rRNA (guanine527-N7)-methyltransferase
LSVKSKFQPARFDRPNLKKDESTDNNALWRIPEWFPNLDKTVAERVKVYHSELLKFNLRLNLISRASERDADETHFADSLFASQMILKSDPGKRIYDIGSGNGLPGVILSILDPSLEILLVESDSRKCEFLKHITHVLQLKNTTVMNIRLETLKASVMHTAVSRGFANISKAVLAVNRCFTTGGKFYHLKGSTWSSEIAEIPSQLISVWSPELIGEYSLPTSQARRAVIVTVKKTS